MPIKCEGCRYFEQPTVIHEKSVRPFRHVSVCTNKLCVPNYFEIKPNFHGLNIDTAREICDREGDGIFVYFEPKEPSAGAAVSEPPASAGGQFVEDTYLVKLNSDCTVTVHRVRYKIPKVLPFLNCIGDAIKVVVRERSLVVSLPDNDGTYEVERIVAADRPLVQMTRNRALAHTAAGGQL